MPRLRVLRAIAATIAAAALSLDYRLLFCRSHEHMIMATYTLFNQQKLHPHRRAPPRSQRVHRVHVRPGLAAILGSHWGGIEKRGRCVWGG